MKRKPGLPKVQTSVNMRIDGAEHEIFQASAIDRLVESELNMQVDLLLASANGLR